MTALGIAMDSNSSNPIVVDVVWCVERVVVEEWEDRKEAQEEVGEEDRGREGVL
jgi:hypothetical protein